MVYILYITPLKLLFSIYLFIYYVTIISLMQLAPRKYPVCLLGHSAAFDTMDHNILITVNLKPMTDGRFLSADFVGRSIFVWHTTDKIGRQNRPIKSEVELGSNFADKIGRFYRSCVICMVMSMVLISPRKIGRNAVLCLHFVFCLHIEVTIRN